MTPSGLASAEGTFREEAVLVRTVNGNVAQAQAHDHHHARDDEVTGASRRDLKVSST